MPVFCVTAVNRGLGLEFTRQLAKDPENTVIGTYRSKSADLTDVKAVASDKTHFVVCDTSEEASIQAFAEQVAKTLNGGKIDYLINNAGVNHAPEQTSLTLTADALYENVKINVLGPAKTTQFLLEQKVLADNARIINMSSGLGSVGVSLNILPRKCAPYSMSKSAQNGLTAQQSGELREHLKGAVVISMDPGWVKTRMGGEGAITEPRDSIAGMLKVIHGLREEDNGKFFSFDGDVVPW